MSSRIRTSLPSTSPTTFRISVSFLPVRRLSMIAREASSRFAMARARVRPPTSGETMTRSSSVELADRVEDHRGGEEVVDRDVEEPLDLGGMEVHGQDAVRARGRQQVGHELGGDRDAGLVLLVLPRVAEVRQHGGDPRGGGPAERVEQDEELHDVVVDGGARRLHDEHVGAPHVLVDLAVVLAVGEVVQRELSERDPEIRADLLRERRMRAAREDLEIAVVEGVTGQARRILRGNRPAVDWRRALAADRLSECGVVSRPRASPSLKRRDWLGR